MYVRYIEYGSMYTWEYIIGVLYIYVYIYIGIGKMVSTLKGNYPTSHIPTYGSTLS